MLISRIVLLFGLFFLISVPHKPSLASPTREFVMSCTYGVLAGTLVGSAMLAFEDQPGDNLNKVARGASLGLYAGIALGLYVVYVVPGQGGDEYEGLPPMEGGYGFKRQKLPALTLQPLFSRNLSQLEGLQAQYRIVEF